jgi:hypothetical protein
MCQKLKVELHPQFKNKEKIHLILTTTKPLNMSKLNNVKLVTGVLLHIR